MYTFGMFGVTAATTYFAQPLFKAGGFPVVDCAYRRDLEPEGCDVGWPDTTAITTANSDGVDDVHLAAASGLWWSQWRIRIEALRA